MFETYLESARGVRISEKRARQELARHSITDPEDISYALTMAYLGDDQYDAGDLLEAIGY